MRLLPLILLCCCIQYACENEYGPLENNVISLNGQNEVDELLFLINIKTSDSTFLAVKSIDSISVFVNSKFWSKVQSDSIDPSRLNTITIGNMLVSKAKISYLVHANQTFDIPDFSRAGDVAQYLNSYYSLQAGDYVCLIESFQITLLDNSVQTVYPYRYVPFTVEKDAEFAYIGELELSLN